MKPKETAEHFILSPSPHAHAPTSVPAIMRDVLIALLPATAAGVWFFGLPAVWTIAVCVGTSLAAESLCRLAMGRPNTLRDGSAAVTGLLLALNLPAGLPLWMCAVGSVFAIAVCKQVFGGLGMNPFNPALAARAFMLVSFTGPMTTWLKPLWWRAPEAVTTATPLAAMKRLYGLDVLAGATPHVEKALAKLPSLGQMLIGEMPGCIGETSALALAAGAAYLLARRVITWHIPASYLAAVAALTLVFSRGEQPLLWMCSQLFSGGLVLSAFFMATDYATSPVTPWGRLLFGAGCGALTVLFRYVGIFPEGVTYAILLMNGFVPIIERCTPPRRFGAQKGAKA
jgi:electron transport complex protein RnfD